MLHIDPSTEQGATPAVRVLLQPGWHNSGPDHWQSLWQRQLGDRASRIEHSDWDKPVLGSWLRTANAAIAAQAGPTVIVAHSLGCVLVAHLAAGPQAHRIAAAFLVAPADVEREGAPAELVNFAPIPMARLTFPAIVVASDDDPYCPLQRSREFAQAWGARFEPLHAAGHITAGTGYGEWPRGFAMLQQLMARAEEQQA